MSTTGASPQRTIESVDDITPEWVTTVLKESYDSPASVVAVAAEPVGAGLTADTFRLRLTFDGPRGDAPETIAAKFAAQDPTSREMGAASGGYAREIGFYSNVSRSAGVRTPNALHASIAPDGAFALVMEDVSPARVVDQIKGCTPEEAAVAVRQAAALHAASWKRSDLAEAAWLGGFHDMLGGLVGAFPTFAATFRETYSDLVSSDVLDVADRLAAIVPAWHARQLPAYSLWHHDFRPDNMLFDANGGADPFVLVDWQTVSYGPGIADVSYFLGCGVTTEDRRAHEKSLVGEYHDELVARGVSDISRDEAWDQYLDHAVSALFMAIHASVRVQRTERGDKLWASWVERAANQITDHDVLARY